jgi:hypothetical protein
MSDFPTMGYVRLWTNAKGGIQADVCVTESTTPEEMDRCEREALVRITPFADRLVELAEKANPKG